MEAVSLSAGAEMFRVLGQWKLRHAASTMHLWLAVQSDNFITTNGRLLGQRASGGSEETLHEREYEFAPMGLSPPTFVAGEYTVLTHPDATVVYLPGHEAEAQTFAAAAESELPMINTWYGPPQERIVVVDLPAGDSSFDSGVMLFTPLAEIDRNNAEMAVAHQLTHACIHSPQLWIEEGLAHFAQALARERQAGRKAALDYMQQYRAPLAEAESQALAPPKDAEDKDKHPPPAAAEKPSPKGDAGEPLAGATDEIYFRWKAMFVWWMLRDMIGDEALQRTVKQFRDAKAGTQAPVEQLVAAQTKRPLQWFFDDWVYHDRGLPDFKIISVYPAPGVGGSVIATVTVQNDGDAGAEVPVIIPVSHGESMQRLQVPGRGKASVRITAPAGISEAIVNDGSVPETDMNNNRFEFSRPPH
jgi:hypothetical protein